jgi:DNA-binding GntR family transcriptional regulator
VLQTAFSCHPSGGLDKVFPWMNNGILVFLYGSQGAMDLLITEKDKNESFSQWVYSVLRKNIINLHLEPGLSVSEATIARLLDTSRTPVRESFIKLAEDGLIEVVSQKGSCVSLIDIDQAEEARFARRIVEKAVIKEACHSFLRDCLFDLKANLEMQKLCKRERTYEKMLDLDNDFHRIIYRGCGKEGLWDHQKKIDYNYDRLRAIRLSSPFPWDEIIEEHNRIGELVRNGDGSAVEEVVEKHLTRSLFDRLVVKYPQYFVQRRHDPLSVSRNHSANTEDKNPVIADSS